jgi:hypothetical protein
MSFLVTSWLCQDVLRRWVELPDDEPLVIGPLTRADIDHLLFSTARIAASIRALQDAVVELSHSRIDSANAAMTIAINANIEGETHMRKLFFSLMKSALEVRENAGK